MSEIELDLNVVLDAVNTVLHDISPTLSKATANTNLDDLGLESLDYMEIFIQLEQAAGVQLDPASNDHPSVVADLRGWRTLPDA